MSKEPEPPPQTTDLSRDKLLADLREVVEFQGRMIELRPIRASDEPAHEDFFNSLDRQDVRFRFFGLVQHPQHDQLIRFTQIDYDEEMAFVAAEIDPPPAHAGSCPGSTGHLEDHRRVCGRGSFIAQGQWAGQTAPGQVD